MPTDSVLVGLIEQSHFAGTLPRRRAAAILLKCIRASAGLPNISVELALIEAPFATRVAREIRILTARYGLDDGSPR